jgi:glycosyltransferase involved in cell wall biosynthesis
MRSRSIVALVHNGFTHDARVLNEARSLAALGQSVTVVAVTGEGLPDRDQRDGIEVRRFGFDPPDTRVWRNRSRISRPWRFRRQLLGWLRNRAAGGPGDRIRGGLGLAMAILLTPWVLLTMAYHYGVRALDRPLARFGWPQPSTLLGEWFERRAREVVFAAHRPLRLRDWGRRVEISIEAGELAAADVWHAHDLETLPLALDLRRKHGGRVVFDSHELFLEAAGRARLGRIKRVILRQAERRWIRQADAVVTVNPSVAAELRRRYRIALPAVVRNCPTRWRPPPAFVSPLRAAAAAEGLEPGRALAIAHGGFQADRGFEELLEAAQPIEDIAVVFLGYGPLESRYRAIAEGPWRGRLVVLPAVDPDDLSAWLAGADFAVCLIQPSTLNHRLSTPNKLFEAIAAGLEVLASDLPAISEVVRGRQLGLLVDPRDIPAIRAALRELAGRHEDQRQEARARAFAAADADLNWEHEFQALLAAYDSLLPRQIPA